MSNEKLRELGARFRSETSEFLTIALLRGLQGWPRKADAPTAAQANAKATDAGSASQHEVAATGLEPIAPHLRTPDLFLRVETPSAATLD